MKSIWHQAKPKLFWWAIGVITGLGLGLDIVFARSIDMSKAGVSLWIFVCVGAFIIMLQLVPAIILFVTFTGSVTHSLHSGISDIVSKDIKSNGIIRQSIQCCSKERE
jgi:hypothetical protein